MLTNLSEVDGLEAVDHKETLSSLKDFYQPEEKVVELMCVDEVVNEREISEIYLILRCNDKNGSKKD